MQKSQRNALIVGDYKSAPRIIGEYDLPRLSCQSTSFEHGVPAAEAIKSNIYQLILLPCRVAPGLHIETAQFQELRQIWNSKLDDQERYFETALQLCRYARQESNPNKNSAVIFADTFNEKGDDLIKDVKKRILEAGGDAYIDCFRDNNEEIFPLVEEKIGWKVLH